MVLELSYPTINEPAVAELLVITPLPVRLATKLLKPLRFRSELDEERFKRESGEPPRAAPNWTVLPAPTLVVPV